jgi:hypothetical protein
MVLSLTGIALVAMLRPFLRVIFLWQVRYLDGTWYMAAITAPIPNSS